MIRPFQGIMPHIDPSVFVDASSVVTGKVVMGPDSSVWPLVSIRGDLMEIRIGARTNIQDGTVIHTTHASRFNPQGFGVEIGDDVTIGHHVTLHGCQIHSESLIGMGTVVLDGAVIESHVVVGAGSLVAPGKRLVSGYLYVGRPAKMVRPLTPEELEFFQYSAQNYIQLAKAHRSES